MKNKKLVLLIAVILCCCVALQFDYLRNSHSHDEMNPFRPAICVGNCVYRELKPSEVRKLHLSVNSCEGLTELGKATDAYGDYHGANTFPGIAYAYPDPDYPNLVVAPVNGVPKVFSFFYFDHPPVYTRELQQIYGSLPADKITIKNRGAESDMEIAITDREAIAQFFDAFNALPGDDCASIYDVSSENLVIDPLNDLRASSGENLVAAPPDENSDSYDNSDDNGRDSNEDLVVASPDENSDSYDDFVDDSSDAYDDFVDDSSDAYDEDTEDGSDYVKYDAVVYLSNGFRFDFSYAPAQTFDSREIESYLHAADINFYGSQALDDWFAAHVN